MGINHNYSLHEKFCDADMKESTQISMFAEAHTKSSKVSPYIMHQREVAAVKQGQSVTGPTPLTIFPPRFPQPNYQELPAQEWHRTRKSGSESCQLSGCLRQEGKQRFMAPAPVNGREEKRGAGETQSVKYLLRPTGKSEAKFVLLGSGALEVCHLGKSYAGLLGITAPERWSLTQGQGQRRCSHESSPTTDLHGKECRMWGAAHRSF